MKIINLIQGSDEWLDYRRKFLGSTDISVLVDMNPYKTRLQVWEEKMNIDFPTVQNEAMRLGSEAESFIRDDYNLYLGTNHKPICAEHENGYFLGSLDGWDEETNSVLEIKYSKYSKLSNCVKKNDINHLMELYPQYVCQMNFFMYIMETDKCTLATYDTEGTLVYMNIPRDEKLINEMVKAGKHFWDNYILTQIPPPKEKGDYTYVNEPEALQIADRLTEIKLERNKLSELDKPLKKQEDELKKALIEFGDDNDFFCGNVKMIRVSKAKMDLSKVCKALDITEEEFKKQYYSQNIGYYKLSVED